VGALQAFANMPAVNAVPANAAIQNPAQTVEGFAIPGMAPLGSAGFAGIGNPGFGGFGAQLGMMTAMHNANAQQQNQQQANTSNISFGTGPTAGMTGASSVGSSAGFGTPSFGAPTNTSAGGFSTVGPSMGMGFEDMFGGPIGFNDSMAGFTGVYGGTDEATGLGFGGMTPSFAMDNALGIGSAGGVPGMTTEQANAALGFSVPTVASQAVPSLVGPSGVTGFGGPLGVGVPGLSLADALGVPTTSVQSTAFGPMGSSVQAGTMANAISQAAEQQAAQATQAAAPASAFGLSGPVGTMGQAVAPMDMATALAVSSALSAPKGSAAQQTDEEQTMAPFTGFGGAGLPAFSAPPAAGGVGIGGLGANSLMSLEAQQAMQEALNFGMPNVQQTMASMNQPFGSALQGTGIGTIGTSTFGLGGPNAPAGFDPTTGVPSAAPAAPTAMAGMFGGEGVQNNAGLGMLGANTAAQVAQAPAIDFASLAIPGMANIDPNVMAAINAMGAVQQAQLEALQRELGGYARGGKVAKKPAAKRKK
jgi:hypothetical protein